MKVKAPEPTRGLQVFVQRTRAGPRGVLNPQLRSLRGQPWKSDFSPSRKAAQLVQDPTLGWFPSGT